MISQEVFRHSDCINSLACSISSTATMPTMCASVGDDQKLRVWEEGGRDDQFTDVEEAKALLGYEETAMLMSPGE